MMKRLGNFRCEFREHEDAGLAGFVALVPEERWDDFRLFLVEAEIEHGATWFPLDAHGYFEYCQFFPGRNQAEVEKVIIAYHVDRSARTL
jgi:hypothetical protein